MTIALYGRKLDISQKPFVEELLYSLKEHELSCIVQKDFARHLKKDLDISFEHGTFKSFDKSNGDVDCLISLGGDGTILDTLRLVRDSGIPVMGINFGRLGFLAGIAKEDVHSAIAAIKNGKCITDRRAVLQLGSSMDTFDFPYALNEFTIQREGNSSMIMIDTYLNDERLNAYWADGIIVATPTGSTGYSLSCGGPIIYPSSDNLVITPIAPHNMNVRPMVITGTGELGFRTMSREKEFVVTLDNRAMNVNNSHRLSIRKADFTFNLLQLNDMTFLNALREKLYWGADQRN